jgi:hypothetical protein
MAEGLGRRSGHPKLNLLNGGLTERRIGPKPKHWPASPSRTGNGTVFRDPANPKFNHVRVDRDEVHVQSGGATLGRDSEVIPQPKLRDPNRHIPKNEFIKWRDWNRR